MLRSGIFSCTCTHMSCYALGSALALAHMRHPTLWDLLLHLHTYFMLRSGVFSCTCTHTSCYSLGSSLALAHIRHTTLWGLLLHLHTYVMLRSGIFSCTCTHTSCHAFHAAVLYIYIYIHIKKKNKKKQYLCYQQYLCYLWTCVAFEYIELVRVFTHHCFFFPCFGGATF